MTHWNADVHVANTKAHRRLYQNPHLDTMLTQAVSPAQQLPGELKESFGRIIRRRAHNVAQRWQ